MAAFGVDYSWGRPGVAALERAGATFACRYLSHDTTGKNLTGAAAVTSGSAKVLYWR